MQFSISLQIISVKKKEMAVAETGCCTPVSALKGRYPQKKIMLTGAFEKKKKKREEDEGRKRCFYAAVNVSGGPSPLKSGAVLVSTNDSSCFGLERVHFLLMTVD